MLERDSKLSELDQRADNLQEGASQFQTQVCIFHGVYNKKASYLKEDMVFSQIPLQQLLKCFADLFTQFVDFLVHTGKEGKSAKKAPSSFRLI